MRKVLLFTIKLMLLLSASVLQSQENFESKLNQSKFSKNESKDLIWTENFEGSLSEMIFYIDCSTDCVWGDVYCESYNGSWSLWCADDGNQAPSTDCSNYINDMCAYVEKSYPGIDINGYSDVKLKFWLKNESEYNCDFVRVFIGECNNNPSCWSEEVQHTGNSGGWIQVIIPVPDSWNKLYWQIKFESDYSICGYEGAYIDDMEVTGNLQSNYPDLEPIGTDFNINGTVIYIETDVCNSSNYNAGESELGYYLSIDQEISNDDFLFGTDYINQLSQWWCSTESIEIDIMNLNPPPPSGLYYIGVYADHLHQVYESNENNNTDVSSFQITVTTTYTITTSSNPSNGGSTTGGGIYTQGQSCTVNATATANSLWQFDNWTENGNIVSNNSNYTFTVYNSRELVANFHDDGIGFDNNYYKNNFVIYPNPTNDEINILFTEKKNKKISININNVFGKMIYFEKDNSALEKLIKIDVSNFPSGIYFVNIQTPDGVITKKIIVLH